MCYFCCYTQKIQWIQAIDILLICLVGNVLLWPVGLNTNRTDIFWHVMDLLLTCLKSVKLQVKKLVFPSMNFSFFMCDILVVIQIAQTQQKKGCYKTVYMTFFHMMHVYQISCIPPCIRSFLIKWLFYDFHIPFIYQNPCLPHCIPHAAIFLTNTEHILPTIYCSLKILVCLRWCW